MKRIMTTAGALIATVTPAFASAGPEPVGTGLFAGLFMAFGLLIVLCQLVPGAVLFASLIKTIIGSPVKKSAPEIGR